MSINKGNAGEWSEPYVLLSLLAEGKIYKSDENLALIKDVWHDIKEIIFKEDSKDINGSLRYDINPDGMTVDVYRKDVLLLKIKREDCKQYAQGLKDAIRTSASNKGTIDVDPKYSEYLTTIGRKVLKASSKETPDIWLHLPDVRNTSDKPLGFSIKSHLGSPPTIFNSSGSSNLIYEICGDVTEEKIQQLKSAVKYDTDFDTGEWIVYPNYPERIRMFKEMGLALKFVSAGSISIDNSEIILNDDNRFEKNLRMVDTSMPEILSAMVAEEYFNGIVNMNDSVKVLNERDPLKMQPSEDYPFYRKKVQDLLVAMTLAMKAAKIWDGKEGTNGGLIIVKEDGDIVCYHIFDRNDFRDFLLNNMKFEIPSNKRYHSMGIACDKGKFYTSLNVQIRMGNKNSINSVRTKEGLYDLENGCYFK